MPAGDQNTQIVTLYEREPAPAETLTPALAAAYGGGLALPQGAGDRPYSLANFVETLDGVVSYDVPGKRGGGTISGESEPDHLVMGLLRALADAVIFGAASLREERGHIHSPAFIYPPLAEEYAALRRRLGRSEGPPISVVVSGSGDVALEEATFHTPGLRAVIATTAQGAQRLAGQTLPAATEVRVVGTDARRVEPTALLALLARDYGVRVALNEGGPTLLSAFLTAGCVDELFLTVAPQVAGRDQDHPDAQRPALVGGHAFSPELAPWAILSGVKRAGSHLLLRYQFR